MNIAQTVFHAVGGKGCAELDRSGNKCLIPGPGHGKDDRSLSVKNDPANPDGFVVNSFAEDDPAECRDHVRQLVGLPSWQPRAERPADPQFVYRDEHGEPYLRVTKVHKGSGKSFYQHSWNGRDWVKGAQQVRIPYRLPEVIAADTVYIVEGEKDADRLAGLGLVATSAPEGAGKWRAELNHWFAGKHVVVLADNDEPGRKHAEQIEEALRGNAASVRSVHFPMLPEKGDVSDYLDLGHGKDDLLAYVAGAGRKPDPKRPVIGTAAKLKNRTFAPIRYVVPGYIAEGCTLLAGRPKLGKSWMVMEMALAVARGKTCLGGIECEQGDVLMLALEDNERRLRSRIGKLMPPLVSKEWPEAFHYATEWPRASDGGLKYINEWLDDHPRARLVIVDVLAQFRPIRSGKEQLYDGDYRAIKDLQEIASKRNVAIVIVHHTRKSQSESGDPFETVSGSLGLSGAADTTLVLDRNSQGCTLYGRGRDIEEIESAVSFDKATAKWIVQGNVSEVRRSSQRDHILQALLEAGEPMSPAVIADVIQAKRDAVRQLLITMVKAGDVMKSTRGMYMHPDFGCDSEKVTTTHHNDHNDHNGHEEEKPHHLDDGDCDSVIVVMAPPHSEEITTPNAYQAAKDGDGTSGPEAPPSPRGLEPLTDADIPAFMKRRAF